MYVHCMKIKVHNFILNKAMFRNVTLSTISSRSYKNFGHKRQPIPGLTTLWHGFLTFTFLGMCLNWDRIGTWIFGTDYKPKDDLDWDSNESS